MPLAPYITLEEFKAYLDDDVLPADAALNAAIVAASSLIETHVNRDFGPGTRTEYFTGNGAAAYFPRATPIASVTSLTLDDKPRETVVVEARRAIQRRDGGYITGEGMLIYTVTDPIPEDVKLATKMTAQAVLESPGLDKNLTGVQIGGVVAGGYDQGGPGAIPRGAVTILASKIRWF